MDEKPEMIMVDPKTFEELNTTLSDLVQFQGWLLSRQDLKAFSELGPIVKRFGDLLAAIAGAANPDLGRFFDINDEFFEMMTRLAEQAKSPEEQQAVFAAVENYKAKVETLCEEIANSKSEPEKH